MERRKTAILHYSAPPVVGGVESVIEAHARVLVDSGCPVKVIAGRGEAGSLPAEAEFYLLPEIDSLHPDILRMNTLLESGVVPEDFETMRGHLVQILRPLLEDVDTVIAHNLFTKHFNLPLTAALLSLVEDQTVRRCLAWCHDFSWTSKNSRSKVFPGYPWDLLRRYHPCLDYITVSEQRREELAELLGQPREKVDVIYNGVDPRVWYGLSEEGWRLVKKFRFLSADLVMVMPVRVTRAKNIELALHVLAKLKRRGLNARLVVTGPPDPHNETSMAHFRSLLDLRKSLDLEQEAHFVFTAGEDASAGQTIPMTVVSELVRACDVVFLPSLREGFGMPVLEAGLAGIAVVASENVPAAHEIGGQNIIPFQTSSGPDEIASLIVREIANSREGRLKRHVRQNLTWEQIFHRQIAAYLGCGSQW